MSKTAAEESAPVSRVTAMSTPKIAVIVGTTRPNRLGRGVGEWVMSQLASRDDATFELVDVADQGLPLLDEPNPAGSGIYTQPYSKAWSEKISAFDGFIFVTAEYNHSVPASFKNAFDFLYHEWSNKPVGFVGYGSVGGVRAIEHWRGIVINAHMRQTRSQVGLTFHEDLIDGISPLELRAGELDAMVDELLRLR